MSCGSRNGNLVPYKDMNKFIFKFIHIVVLDLSLLMFLTACSSKEVKHSNNNQKSSNGEMLVQPEDQVYAQNKDAVRAMQAVKIDAYEKTRFIANAITDNGKATGFRCVSILENDRNPFSKAGIQVNDVVLAVNNRDLQTAKEASFFLELVKLNKYSSIKIQRGERIFTLKKINFGEEES